MIAARVSKTILVAAVALLVSLVAFGNITDPQTNRAFAAHVLAMDSIFPDSAIRYRAVTDPALQGAAYSLIIAAESGTALLCWIGAGILLSRLRAPAAAFNHAKRWSIAGLSLGFLVWQAGFLSIGGEWFGMWQSQAWNGEESAFRFAMTMVGVLIYVVMPDGEPGG